MAKSRLTDQHTYLAEVYSGSNVKLAERAFFVDDLPLVASICRDTLEEFSVGDYLVLLDKNGNPVPAMEPEAA